MGSALTTAFLYWFGTAATIMTMAYMCNAHVRPMQVLSLVVSDWSRFIGTPSYPIQFYSDNAPGTFQTGYFFAVKLGEY